MQTNIFWIKTKKKKNHYIAYVFNQVKIVLIDNYWIFIQKKKFENINCIISYTIIQYIWIYRLKIVK